MIFAIIKFTMNKILTQNNFKYAKPFLKWAGGKTQLIPELIKRLPDEIKANKRIKRYIEPFVGGGALFFYLKNFFIIEQAFLFDINKELVLTYKVLQKHVNNLIIFLENLENEYFKKTIEEKKRFYYKIRELYNKQITEFDYEIFNQHWIRRAAYLIFLNKTCYNGLFRQNKKGEFNVPFGKYKNPKICDKENLLAVNKALKNTKIFCGDFTHSEKYITKGSLVYFDPPYLPISETSSFTSYSKENFTIEDQIRLAEFYKQMDKKGAFLILSNSDPKNTDPNNTFFENLYKGFKIERVPAKRYINCNADGRGEIFELIITNYK